MRPEMRKQTENTELKNVVGKIRNTLNDLTSRVTALRTEILSTKMS